MTYSVIALAGRMGVGKDTAANLLVERHGYDVVGLADELKRLAVDWFSLPPEAAWGPSEERNKPLGVVPALDAVLSRAMYALDKRPLAVPVSADPLARLSEVFLPRWPLQTARQVLQLLGTEWGRSLNDEVWLYAVKHTVERIRRGDRHTRQEGALSILRAERPSTGVVIPDCRFPNEAKFLKEHLGAKVVWIDASLRVRTDAVFAHASEPSFSDLEPYVDRVLENNGTEAEFRDAVLATLP